MRRFRPATGKTLAFVLTAVVTLGIAGTSAVGRRDPQLIDQTSARPDQAVQILQHCRSNSSDPTISIEEKNRYKLTPKPLHNSRAIIDACRPLEWKEQWYPVARLSNELRQKLLNKWKDQL